MGKTTKPSPSRLKEINRRQDPPRFGPDYDPSIRATREEAPSISHAVQVWCERVGRTVHSVSLPELGALVIGLYHWRTWEVQEQRMLPTLPRPHPLAGHPRAAGMILPPMRGTVDVAAALGVLHLHPVIVVPDENGSTASKLVPFPWFGDLLFFLEDELGPYCVNWSIKNAPEDFERPHAARPLTGKRAAKAREKALARHAVEAQLYLDVGIRTVQVTKADYDEAVVANLVQVLRFDRRQVPFTDEQRSEIVDRFRATLITGDAPIEVSFQLSARYGWTIYDIRNVLYQSIWRRQLRVDLFQALLFDKPLRPERTDVLELYADWFGRV